MKVEVGQEWLDCDWRLKGRRIVKVVKILKKAGVAKVEVLTDGEGNPPRPASRFTKIKLTRFKPGSTGYRLKVVEPAPVVEQQQQPPPPIDESKAIAASAPPPPEDADGLLA